jgi:hypothetical protein
MLLSAHGQLRAQDISDWKGTVALPPLLARFYQEIGPVNITIKSYGNPFFLPSLASLWEFQAGYRWNGNTGEPIPAWDDDWLVVADAGGDPFILSRGSGAVLFAQHGVGQWDAGTLFEDVIAMAACLGALGGVVLDAGSGFTDEDSNIRPEHCAAADHLLIAILGSRDRADAVLTSLGWQ